MKLLIIHLDKTEASDIRIQNKIRDCLVKFKPDKNKCGVKVPVVAAVRDINQCNPALSLGEQFCVGDILGASKLLSDNSINFNLKSLVS